MTKKILPAALLSVALLAGVALRLWNLGQTSWQFDEIVYHQIAANVLQHGLLAEKITYRQSYQPFLYQPPWYLHLLAGWFWLTRPTIYSARLLGVIFSTCSLAMIWLLMRRLAGAWAACLAAIPLVFDGWLLYVQRVSYIENLILMVIIAGFLLYQIGLDTSRTWWFAACGAVFGVGACLKYTGVYAIVALAISWLIVRRDNGRHAVAVGTAVGTLAVDQVYLVLRYGHAYLSETAVQIRRVLGLQYSGGTLTSPRALLHLLFAQYDIFAASFLVAVAGLLIVLTYLIRCYRARSWQPVQGQAVLFSWAAAGVAIFGLSSLRYPQYFALILVPLYLLFWRTLMDNRRAWLKYACVTVAVAAGLVSYRLSTDRQQVNPYARVAQFTATHVPSGAVVIADEQIGDLLTQPFCKEQVASPCLHRASYAITWDTYLQSTQKLGDGAFQTEFAGATPLYSATGFSGTATIWKLKSAVRHRSRNPLVGVDVAAFRDYTRAQTQAYGARLMPYIRRTLHAGAVSIVWDLCDPTFRSDIVRQCRQSLSPTDVAVLIRQATASHLRVQLRPLIRVGPPAGWNDAKRSWEGHIRPRDPKAWFAHLLAAERPYLTLLRRAPGSQVVTGTELAGITQGWSRFLSSAQRACGTCSVTASVWHGDYKARKLPPVRAVGVDWYPVLRLSSRASQAAVTRAWERSLAAIPRQLLARTTLDETSIRATAGAYSNPSDWNQGGRPDQLVQARYFTAACQTARHYHMAGLYFYEIPLTFNLAHPNKFPAFFVGTWGAVAIRRCNS